MANEDAAAAWRLLLAAALVLAASTVPFAAAQATKSEAEVLVEFRAALRGPNGGPPGQLNQWATSQGAPCIDNATQWTGVKHCVNGRVVVLELDGLRLQGAAPDLALLAPLQGLRSLSLGNNNLTGAFPDVSALPALRFLLLEQNRLGGEIPDTAFKALTGLEKLNLSGNAFSGPIPSSIAASGHLLSVDLSNNNFSGPIPEGLRKLGANVNLQGNKLLCGDLVGTPCPADTPRPSPSSSSAQSSRSMKLMITIAIVVIKFGSVQ